MKRAVVLVIAGTACVWTPPAQAKEFGVRSPEGREIYKKDEPFGAVANQSTRRVVAEVAAGAGPEGNLAILFGVLNVGFAGLDLYGGAGFEVNPARHYTGAARLYGKFAGFRPYVSLGYLFVDKFDLGTFTHNVFAEIGHAWKYHQTYHITASVGLRYLAYIGFTEDSTLKKDDVDPVALDRAVDETARFVPLFALRLSRAF